VCDFNEFVYGPRSHWPEELKILLSMNSDDLPYHHTPHPLYKCGVPARKGVVPSELGYGYFCGNVVGEDDAWVSKYLQSFYWPFYLLLMTRDLSFSAAYKKVRMRDVRGP
jgi:hypothetical protein